MSQHCITLLKNNNNNNKGKEKEEKNPDPTSVLFTSDSAHCAPEFRSLPTSRAHSENFYTTTFFTKTLRGGGGGDPILTCPSSCTGHWNTVQEKAATGARQAAGRPASGSACLCGRSRRLLPGQATLKSAVVFPAA